MKQLITSINSPAFIFRLQHSLKNQFLVLMIGIAVFFTSCQKEEQQGNLLKQDLSNGLQKEDIQKKPRPFEGQFAISLIESGVTGTGEGSHIGKFSLVAHDNEENFPDITVR